MKRFLNDLYTNSSRVHLLEFVSRAASSLPSNSLALDAGAGKCPYKYLFKHAIYESTDFCQIDDMAYGEITYVCDLTSIPVEDARYDMVLCTQVISELPDPDLALKELFRILKPGKELWISAPLFYAELPIQYDYFRFTQYGFRYLLEKAGFEILSTEWLEGYAGTLAYQFKTAAGALSITPRDYGGGFGGLLGAALSIILKPVLYLLALIYSRLDIRHKYQSRGYPKNYAVIARKPASIGK
jgi:SAM-dependent methyltransferase